MESTGVLEITVESTGVLEIAVESTGVLEVTSGECMCIRDLR